MSKKTQTNLHIVGATDEPKTTVSGGGGDGTGTDARLSAVESRLAVVESELKHLATKQGLEELKTLIESKDSRLAWRLNGILAAVIVAVVIALIRTFIPV